MNRAAEILLSASIATALSAVIKPALADGPPVIKYDIASGGRAIWGIGGNLPLDGYGRGQVSTAIGDIDGDGILNVGVVATTGGSSVVVSKKSYDAYNALATEARSTDTLLHAAFGNFGDTYTDSNGVTRKGGSVVACDFNYKEGSRISSWSWGASNPTNVGTGGMSAGRSFAPYGPNYTGDIAITAGDLDGDGFDELVTAAESQTPPLNGALSRQISVFKPTSTSFAPLVSFDPTDKGSVGSITVVAGKFADPTNDWILSSFTDPSTNLPTLKLFSITAEVQPVGVTIDTSAARYLDAKNIVHRDIACRCAVGDLDGDGQDEIVMSGNDGTAPFVDILKLAYTPSPGGGMPVVKVASEFPVDLSGVMGLEPADEWSTMVFDPSVTGTVFTATSDPAAVPADAVSGFSGTLFLSTASVPEPGTIGLFTAAVSMVIARRRRR